MRRFWREVSVEPGDGGFRVMLDGRPVRTPVGNPQVVPMAALAQALADEWRAQGEQVDPAGFALRDLADFAIDVVASERAETIGKLLGYAETDTLCYRADPDEPLSRRQREVWEPLLSELELRLGIRFERVCGVVHRSQPPATLAALRAEIERENAFRLSALLAMTSLAASLVVGLAALAPKADAVALWAIANLEEDWQAERWGEDAEASYRRARRLAAFTAATCFAALAGS